MKVSGVFSLELMKSGFCPFQSEVVADCFSFLFFSLNRISVAGFLLFMLHCGTDSCIIKVTFLKDEKN